MGIQDRDYYWERHRENARASNFDQYARKINRVNAKPPSNNGFFKTLWSVICILLSFYVFFFITGKIQDRYNAKFPFQAPSQGALPFTPTELIEGGIEIKADIQGHYRGTVEINGVSMPFMIDTGATAVTLPVNLAINAGVPIGSPVVANTAGGRVVQNLATVRTLKIGNAVLHDVQASTNPHINEVLIGMSALKYFNVTHSNNTMTLVGNGSSSKLIERPSQDFASIRPPSAPVLMAPQISPAIAPLIPSVAAPVEKAREKRPLIVHKTVTCDANKICTTKYSDKP
ncbi:hypothetical protein BJL95_21315 [Methylomonas sp. LWB]|uniref:retropepsin-like aspartic protease family protein n=1 Tax=Methylomonas sp. LWB TaxID=1905845 RepID=UPI0008DA5819|nr:retropepsin-like aspartic protease [Methylomonas sp. LWB]OHX37208.1 hypothetical protein BJL95_21315 [Methylomonas sp. LWB]